MAKSRAGKGTGELTPVGDLVADWLPEVKKTTVEGAQKVLPGMEFPVKKLAPPTIAQNRLLNAIEDIYSDDPAELRFLHVVLAQCGLPYREPESGLQFYEKRNGRTSLVLTQGSCSTPKPVRRPCRESLTVPSLGC